MGDIVWSEARHTEVQVMSTADAEEAFSAEDEIIGTHVLFIGGDLGLVVHGDLAGLERVARRVLAAVVQARDVESLPAGTGADDLCGGPGRSAV